MGKEVSVSCCCRRDCVLWVAECMRDNTQPDVFVGEYDGVKH